MLASNGLTWTRLYIWESSLAPWPHAPHQGCWGPHSPAKHCVSCLADQTNCLPMPIPATGSFPCPRHEDSSSWRGIQTRCPRPWLACCDSAAEVRSILRWTEICSSCTIVFTISHILLGFALLIFPGGCSFKIYLEVNKYLSYVRKMILVRMTNFTKICLKVAITFLHDTKEQAIFTLSIDLNYTTYFTTEYFSRISYKIIWRCYLST